MTTNGSSPDKRVTVTINGESVETQDGRLLIDVAEEIGVFVPRFCYHPGMKSVAVCRMCLVAVEGQRKLLPACATPVAEGMNVNTVEEQAVDAQQGMLEFLLINHPLDCPICDRAGECPLQDQTYRHGPGTTRYVEPKRTYEKPLEISSLVVLDRERCVLCWRCVRFADEVAGDQFIQLVDRGAGTQILTFKDDPFDSYFSGNTVQICPVGALTSKPYRFVSRPWNLKSAPTICGYCAVGCPMTNESRADKLVRCQALPNENVNDFWTCDKGRFGYHYVDSEDRLSNPLVRGGGGEFEPTGWGRALAMVAERIKSARGVGVIAGAHLTTEDAFAISRLARGVIETPHLDSRLQDADAPYELALAALSVAGSTATMNDLENASSIVSVGPDPKETLPVLFLRLRKAVFERGAELAVVAPRRISLDAFATRLVRAEAGGEAAAVDGLSRDGLDLGESPVVCWGPSSPGRDDSPVLAAALRLVEKTGARFLMCPPHAGSQGFLDMGVHPRLGPGHQAVSEQGMGTREILEATVSGEIDVLLLFGADVAGDFPDADLAERALSSGAFTVVMELLPSSTLGYADVVLPSAAYAERAGTFTNLERRLQKLEPAVSPPGSASEPWRACVRLAAALGKQWEWHDLSAVWADLTSEVPTHAGVDIDALTQPAPTPAAHLGGGWQGDRNLDQTLVAGPGGQYPKGLRSGAPFQTGQNWPLSWELRHFEARQRPGYIPAVDHSSRAAQSEPGAGSAEPDEAGRSPAADAPASPDEQSQDEFVLYTGRMIYDEGEMVSRTAALRGIAKRPYVEIGERDAARLGIADGDDAVVSSNGFETRLRAVVTDIADGAVFVPYAQQGLRANKLISGINPRVRVAKA